MKKPSRLHAVTVLTAVLGVAGVASVALLAQSGVLEDVLTPARAGRLLALLGLSAALAVSITLAGRYEEEEPPPLPRKRARKQR